MKRWLLAGVWALSASAYADSVVEGEVELGVGHLDESAFRYGKYSGLVDDGLEVIADFTLTSRPVWDSGVTRYWSLTGQRLGFDSRRVAVEAGGQGRQRLRLSFQETPRNLFEDGQTPFLGGGRPHLILPSGWEADEASTAAMTNLDDNLLDFSQRQRRRDAELDYRLHFAEGWRLDATMRRQAKDGRSGVAGTFGTNGGNSRAALLAAPVEYETDSFDVSVIREGAKHLLGMAWHGSFFRNQHRELSWQNPFGPQPQWQPGAAFPDGVGSLALPPDNDFQQLRLFGQFTLTPSTRASVDLARGRMRQDQRFLPYSVDGDLAPIPLPRADLNAKVDTTRAHLRINSRPLPRLNVVGRIRFDERDNETPRNVYLPVSGDAGLQVTAENGRINRPYGLTRREMGIDAAYRLPQRTRLNLGYEHRLRKRDFSEVNTTREHVFRGGLSTHRFQAVSLGLEASHERRHGSRYVGNRPFLATRVPGSVDPEAFENHPNLRRYYLADRDRDRVQIRADVHPADPWHLGVAFAWSRDDYGEDLFGLDESRLRSWMLDAGVVPGDSVRLSAFYHHDRYANAQRARSFTAAPGTADDPDRNWSVDTRDIHETWGLSLDLEDLEAGFATTDGSGRKLDLSLGYTDSRSEGRIGVEAGRALTATDLPNLSTRFQVLSITATQRLSEAARIRFAFEHERYKSRDFALDGVSPDSVSQVLLFGEASPRYRANWFTLSYLHRF